MKKEPVSGDESEAREIVDWWAAAAASEDPEYLANFWYPRAEETVAFGSKWFDADLNPLDRASDEVAVEVQLIRDPQEAECRARFEIRTNLAFFSDGSNPARVRQLVNTIARAQRELADRAGLFFAEPGAAKPHVLTSGSRGLLRAYGKGNVFDVQEAAQPLLRAYGFLAHVWRAALIDCDAVSVARVRRIAEDAIAAENMDMAFLFAGRGDRSSPADDLPELNDELVVRVGVALGCPRRPDGCYGHPSTPIDGAATPPTGVVRMVAEDLAATEGVEVDSLLRKVLQPMLDGEFNGLILRCTATEAAALREESRQRQTARRSQAED